MKFFEVCFSNLLLLNIAKPTVIDLSGTEIDFEGQAKELFYQASNHYFILKTVFSSYLYQDLMDHSFDWHDLHLR